MSGITGWVDYSKQLINDGEAVKMMTKRLMRGMSGSGGSWVSEHTLLGSAEPGDAQPAISKRGDAMYILVFCGELYNTADIIRELEGKGCRFDTRSDADAILQAYMEWGAEFLSKLNGMFALAIRDVAGNRLFIARDRLGQKPLFYHRTKSGLIFASELKALLAHPEITPKLGSEGLAEIFAVGPARTPGCGVFSGIDELKPGHYMTVEPSGIEIKRYWSLLSRPHEESFEETVNSVRELTFDAVRRQINGGGTAFLLSGGLDSSAVCAIAANELGETLKTLSVDYVGNDRNFRPSAFQPNTDAPWVRRMAGFLKSSHETCMLGTKELTGAIFDAVPARDLPGMTDIDSSLMLFSNWIAERSKIGLTGEGADEIFGGYPWFYRPQEPGSDDTFPWSKRLPERIKVCSPELLAQIRPEEYVRARYEQALGEIPALDGEAEEEARVRKISYLTITRWLPTLLDRQSRMSAAAGLSLRSPFCDYRLVEYTWNVPWSMKYRGGREKALLRHAMYGVLPDDVLWRKKSPFPKTHDPNFIEVLRSMTYRMLDDGNSPLLPLIDKTHVRRLASAMTRETDIPWFGQLMNAPQLLAYLLQTDFWLREYKVVL